MRLLKQRPPIESFPGETHTCAHLESADNLIIRASKLDLFLFHGDSPSRRKLAVLLQYIILLSTPLDLNPVAITSHISRLADCTNSIGFVGESTLLCCILDPFKGSGSLLTVLTDLYIHSFFLFSLFLFVPLFFCFTFFIVCG